MAHVSDSGDNPSKNTAELKKSEAGKISLEHELQITGSISAQLVPDFLRKLSFFENQRQEDAETPHGNKYPSENTGSGVVGDGDETVAAYTVETSSIITTNTFVCSCGEKFEKSVQLAAHKRWSCQQKGKTAQCDVCKNWFASEMGLRRHMKHAHGGVFSCDDCNLRFHNKIKLTRHTIEAHYKEGEDKAQMKCYECGDTNFDNKFELECHLVLHKYEKRQQKLAHHDLWSHHAHHHFAPYPPQQFMGTPRPPFWGHQRSPWMHFPFRHPLPPHFMHRPPFPSPLFHHPPPPPPPPPCMFPQTADTFMSVYDNESSVVSAAGASNVDGNVIINSENYSSHHPQEMSSHRPQEMSSQPPRHDHEYVEPTALPCLFAEHQKSRHLKHFDHHGKMKWKKYLKLMIKGKVPPLWSGIKSADLLPQSQASSVRDDSSNVSFKIACKFCDKVVDKNNIAWHQRKECPILSVHRCGVCDKVFKKRHFLIKHMHEQNHYGISSVGVLTRSIPNAEDSNSLTSLPEKLNTSLNFSEDPARVNRSHNSESASCQPCQATVVDPRDKINNLMSGVLQTVKIQPQSNETQIINNGKENIGNSNVRDERIDTVHSEHLQCVTCKHVCQSIQHLAEHLREHINQILAIQKVREWTSKSSEYFFLRHDDEEDELERPGSAAATSTSYLDSELTSATGSSVPDISSNFSGLGSSVSKDPKWLKPHKKRSEYHHHKGEIRICEFCNEKFAFRKDLYYHMETKHKDSTLECPVCRKKFSWKKRGKFYERHLNSHYGVKVFKHKCEVCGKTFLENSKLRAHMSLHNSELLHKCSVCGKAYANKSSLVRHERKHTGEKPYQCDICQAGFMEKRELLRHSTTHTGVAPFICKECGQGFTLKTSLVSHMKKKHSKKSEKV